MTLKEIKHNLSLNNLRIANVTKVKGSLFSDLQICQFIQAYQSFYEITQFPASNFHSASSCKLKLLFLSSLIFPYSFEIISLYFCSLSSLSFLHVVSGSENLCLRSLLHMDLSILNSLTIPSN